ncbi:kinase-like protein [Artomyces pyxidatus]|uniref:Kinase-like protein n=1 Tax=Artomyces pyxidatus TaxID=48021 RepID=A0ACB8SR00_9AGAM|nr:kinase-like protein [Artomyces pyxidatus]
MSGMLECETISLLVRLVPDRGPEKVEDLRFLPPRASTAHSNNDDALEVLNVVLVASVDGKFHALNRTSGQILWSMPSTPFTPPPSDVRDSSQSRPYFLQPLVSTQHPEYDPELDDTYPQETYIIEPQSGDIYVTSSSSEPLQRLPFSMSQLVDMSPFSFGDSDRRVFVGRKKTSLLIIELETGRVKAALDSECPWDPFEDFVEQETDDVDLDELDGTKPAREYPTDIFIGRTDYHISIHTRPLSPSARRPPVQNLSFSTYGPNNQDLEQQASYKRAVDDVYVETLPNGEIISFKTRASDVPLGSHIPDNTFVWGQRFSNPIVAVFDVVKSARRDAPFVLLQPRPRLDDIYPSSDLSAAARQHRFNPEIAYVGLVRETGSLYALSPDHFPLVVFGGPDTEPGLGIDPPPGVMDPHETSSQTDMRSLCRSGSSDRRCSTGVRQLRADSRSRLARLLDGVPQVLPPPSTNTNQLYADAEAEDATLRVGGNRSILHSWPWMIAGQQPHQIGEAPLADHPVALAVLTSIFAGLMLWVVGRKALGSSRRDAGTPAAVTAAVPDSDAIVVSTTIQEPIPVIVDVPLIADLDTSDKSHLDVPASPPPVAQTPTQAEPTPQLQPRALPEIVTVDSPPVQESSDPSEEAGDDESEKEGDAAAVPGKRKTARRRRGKKKRGGQKDAAADEGDVDEPEKWEVVDAGGDSAGQNVVAAGSSNILIVPPTPTPTTPSLIVSDTILGFGSHGTVVYQGSLQGRAVAVKRLLQDFVTLASREVTLLQDADDHPNVIRYYYQESQANFLYIALELCPASLADIIERPDQFREIAIAFNPKRALRQVTSGLRHLHALKIVHRDIKPQNILISSAKKGESSGHRMLISDFGLCRKLESDQTSFLPTANGMMGVGTVGWRAPEILRGEVKLDETTGDDHSQSSRDSVGTATGSVNSGMGRPATRLTKSVDIFALGCLYYYCLSNGGHPFGDRFEREVNILRNSRSLDALEGFGEEGSEAVDLISSMLAPEASDRPDTTQCLMHPYFWDPGRRLGFLQDASDRFEIMCRDPRDPNLVALETGAVNVVGQDWAARLDKIFVENLGKFRKYDGKSVQDLLRALRNKKHHYQDLPENVKRHVGSMPEGYLLYFTRRYPRLFLHVHSVVSDSSLRQESMFRSYFELTD